MQLYHRASRVRVTFLLLLFQLLLLLSLPLHFILFSSHHSSSRCWAVGAAAAFCPQYLLLLLLLLLCAISLNTIQGCDTARMLAVIGHSANPDQRHTHTHCYLALAVCVCVCCQPLLIALCVPAEMFRQQHSTLQSFCCFALTAAAPRLAISALLSPLWLCLIILWLRQKAAHMCTCGRLCVCVCVYVYVCLCLPMPNFE